MARWHVRFHRLASKEYLHEIRWYARRSIRAANRFMAAIDAVVERIAEAPERSPEYRDDIRWIRPRRFPHVLFFWIVDEETIEVVAVAHGLRKPDYWVRRLKKP